VIATSLRTARQGSLRHYLLARLLGGLWACMLLWIVVTWVVDFRQLAAAQDARLLARWNAADRNPALLQPLGERAIRADDAWRLTGRDGQWIAGDPSLTAAMAVLPGQPALRLVDRNGTLMRAAAAWTSQPCCGAPDRALLQVAEPWAYRLPPLDDVFNTTTWMALTVTLTMSTLVVSTVHGLGRWLAQAESALMHPDQHPAYGGPEELRPSVMKVRELHAAQRRWVDDQRLFLADASHQLRTPMAVLRTQLQSAISGDVLASEILPQMLHTVDRAAAMANNLLSLTKLEQLKRSGALASIDLAVIARDAVVEIAPLIAHKRLDFALEGAAPTVVGDAVMLGELLRNLLANAIHHTPPGGAMGVLLRAFAGRVDLVVWDSGPGLDDEVQQRLFQPFSAAKGGVGLGLSICRQIAEAMNAQVQLYNRIAAEHVIGVDAVVSWQQAP
jgi:two-component system sensor histidine kinase TctE